jgi:RimJ/RimL family protein N-acetyltransferase
MYKKEIYLDVINTGDCEQVRKWRNKLPATLRTPYNLTYEQQQDFYKNIICNRDSKHRYFGIFITENKNMFIGMGGITNIEWENGIGEISLILDPEFTGKGYGKESVRLLLDKAFNEMRLDNIYGECYECNKNIGFWERIIVLYDSYKTYLPFRKFYNGKYYNSLYFNFNKYYDKLDGEKE